MKRMILSQFQWEILMVKVDNENEATARIESALYSAGRPSNRRILSERQVQNQEKQH